MTAEKIRLNPENKRQKNYLKRISYDIEAIFCSLLENTPTIQYNKLLNTSVDFVYSSHFCFLIDEWKNLFRLSALNKKKMGGFRRKID